MKTIEIMSEHKDQRMNGMGHTMHTAQQNERATGQTTGQERVQGNSWAGRLLKTLCNIVLMSTMLGWMGSSWAAPTLTASPNPSAVGQSVSLTATVITALSPPGTVTFKDGTTALATVTLTASGLRSLSATATLNYTFTTAGAHSITAVYSGDSSISAALAQTVNGTVPGAPTIGTATGGNAQATVAFTAPTSNGGSAITSYTATSTPGSKTGTCTTSPCTVTGLTNGTAYTFKVTATNVAGTGTASAASNSVTLAITVPGAPTGASAVGGNAQATVTFTAPASNGGSAITGYTVTSLPAGGVDSNAGTTGLSHVITGLTNGTAYTFTVKATNAIGTSAASTATASVTPATVPGAPTGAAAVSSNAQATVTFKAPASNGGSAITGYTVTSLPAGGVDSNAGTTGLSHVITGLTNGTAYTFTVKATNAKGSSVASAASSSVTPAATVPGAPVIGTATAGNAQATVTFTAPATNGGSAITGYTVTSLPAGGVDSNAGTTGLSHVITGLTNGTAYTFTVKATNAIGTSVASAATASVIPATVPGAPTIGTATGGNAKATISFTAPASNGGSAITGYTVTSLPAGGVDSNAGTTGLSHVITGLTNGTAYTFTVKATNAKGSSAASAASNSVTPAPTVPGAPTIGTATAGNAQATVTFTAPATNGGSAITGYTVTSLPAGGVDTNAGTTGLSHVITGLANGTAYTFTVKATNAIGTSVASAATASVTPATVPGAPTGATAVGGNAKATVTFKAPASNGGSAITGYTVTSLPAGGVDSNAGTTGLSHVITGLTNGTAYTFTVKATNAKGSSAASTASNSVTPAATVPGAPVIGTATAGNAQATVTFTAPATNGGSAITGYTVTSLPAGGVDSNAGTTGLSHVITGLTNGTAYTFTVKATNAVGTSAASAASNSVTPVTVPGAPTGATAVGGNAKATVSFTASATNGGSAITGYTVTSLPAGGVDSNAGTTGLSHVITGLTNGTAYTFTVKAANAKGTSVASAASNSVTPAATASTTTLASSVNPSSFGQTTTLTATVTGVSPTGSVTFKDGTTTLATVTLTAGKATFSTTFTLGTHSLTAVYGGDAYNVTSTSAAVTQTVNQAPTTTTLTASSSSTTTGKTITLTAAVTGVSPTGTVNFKDGATQVGSATLNAGQATTTTTFSTVGAHQLTAVYAGDTNNATSTSTAVAVIVNTGVIAQAYYIHTDHLDSPRQITDTAGNVVWEWQNSDPFGNNPPNENPNGAGQFTFPLRFPGQYADKETNTYYNYFRDYDPSIGRYIESDPLGINGGLNTYTYANANPLSLIDPDGLCPSFMVVYGSPGAINREKCYRKGIVASYQTQRIIQFVLKLTGTEGSCDCANSITCIYDLVLNSSERHTPCGGGAFSPWADAGGRRSLGPLRVPYDCKSGKLDFSDASLRGYKQGDPPQ